MTDTPDDRILHALPHAAMVVDFDGRVVAANAAAGAAEGRELRACLSGWTRADEIAAAAADAAGSPGSRHEYAAESLEAGGGGAVIRVSGIDIAGAARALVVIETRTTDASLARRVEVLEGHLGRVRDVRHELNNVLMGLLGHAELLGRAEELSATSRRRLATIVEQAGRLREQIEALRHETKLDDRHD